MADSHCDCCKGATLAVPDESRRLIKTLFSILYKPSTSNSFQSLSSILLKRDFQIRLGLLPHPEHCVLHPDIIRSIKTSWLCKWADHPIIRDIPWIFWPRTFLAQLEFKKSLRQNKNGNELKDSSSPSSENLRNGLV